MGGRPVTIRTLDLGADKIVGYRRGGGPESNPALGLRSLRLSLRDPELFRPQLRALIRAAALGDVRILFPLVTTLAELRAARAVLDEVAAGLRAEGRAVPDKIPVGVMVEVPAAALMADHLAKEVDFFSIGTNDLIQYTLAVDRTNETVAELYSAADPSVLRLIAMVVDASRRGGVPASVCGAMGGEPLYAMLLLGLGIRQLSMPPHQLPEIKRVIRGIRLADAEALAAEALRRRTAREVVELLESALGRAVSDPPDPLAVASRPSGPADLLGRVTAG
jgi:phosphotransferase system enzyme I (PtsI)